MTHDIEVLKAWILVCVVIASIGATSVPVLYSFFPWRLRPIGKLFMLQSISFALALDFTVVFNVWPPKNILVLFWVNAFVFTFIAASTTSMAVWFASRMCLYPKKGTEDVPAE